MPADNPSNGPDPYNPLDKRNLGTSVSDAMLSKELVLLPPGETFLGAGIYAIYSRGNHPLYRALLEAERSRGTRIPIYVGKAVPEGARKGGPGIDVPSGPVLYKRLREHAESITEATNLKLGDFECRYLIVDDIWIPLGESLLIKKFAPLWNLVVDGFGNHDPGKGRHNQRRSPWDVVHPGRSWAKPLQPGLRTQVEIASDVEKFFSISEGA